jgi:hypothetical protein
MLFSFAFETVKISLADENGYISWFIPILFYSGTAYRTALAV